MELFLCWLIIGMLVVMYVEILEAILLSDYEYYKEYHKAAKERPWYEDVSIVLLAALLWPITLFITG